MDEAKLDKLLDDEFGDDVDEDMEDKGDDVDELYGDGGDWIVDDDGTYGVEDGEKTRGGRTEVGEYRCGVRVTRLTSGKCHESTRAVHAR